MEKKHEDISLEDISNLRCFGVLTLFDAEAAQVRNILGREIVMFVSSVE
jgi:hypothetical protein